MSHAILSPEAGRHAPPLSPEDQAKLEVIESQFQEELVRLNVNTVSVHELTAHAEDEAQQALGTFSIPKTPEAQEQRQAPAPSIIATEMGRTALKNEVRLAAEVSPDALAEARMRNAQVIGEAAVSVTVKKETVQPKHETNLAEDFRLAAAGEKTANKRVEVNAVSEAIEMACKSGAEMIAHAQIIDGDLIQYGQGTRSRQYNTLTTYTHAFKGLQEMTESEGQNAFLIGALFKRGELQKGNKVVEMSFVPDGSHESLKGSGLFLREVTAIIRVTEADADGNVTIKSYLFGGTDQSKLPSMSEAKNEADQDKIEKQALENRFDIAVARRLLRQFGVANADELSPAEILRTPLIVSGKVDGIDIAMAYDAAATEITGKLTMMGSSELHEKNAGGRGRPLTRADYEAHFASIRKLQQELQTVGRRVAQECTQRWREVAGDPYEAGRLMHRLTEQAVAAYFGQRLAEAFTNPDEAARRAMPDITVLGVKSYHNFIAYQQHLMHGDMTRASQALNGAIKSARGTGCPTGIRNATGTAGDNPDGLNGGVGQEGDQSSDSSSESKKWRWKKGVCRVPSCHTRPGTTMVGPCDVCWSCQKKFDKGLDPTKEAPRSAESSKARAANKTGVNGIGLWISSGKPKQESSPKKQAARAGKKKSDYALAA